MGGGTDTMRVVGLPHAVYSLTYEWALRDAAGFGNGWKRHRFPKHKQNVADLIRHYARSNALSDSSDWPFPSFPRNLRYRLNLSTETVAESG